MEDNSVEAEIDSALDRVEASNSVAELDGVDPSEVAAPATPMDSSEAAESVAVRNGSVQEVLDRLDSRLEESQRLLGRQSDLVDRLHAENQDLRAGELRTAQMPLIRDLLRLSDDIDRMREAACDADGDLRVVQESLADTLSRNGIQSFAPAQGEPFDPKLHSASGIVETEDTSIDRAVAEVVKQGFRWDSGEVVRVAEVRAYRFVGAD